MFGWTPDLAFLYVFLPVMACKLIVQAAGAKLLSRFGSAPAAIAVSIASVGAMLFLVHWSDLATPSGYIEFMLGILLIAVDAFSVTLHTAILTEKLTPELQVKFQTRVGVATQIARATAPVLGTVVYAALSSNFGLGWAYNGFTFTSAFFLVLGHLLGLINFRSLYSTPCAAKALL